MSMCMEAITPRRPVERLIFEFNGHEKLAALIGVHRNTTQTWAKRDHIPPKYHRMLRSLARQYGLPVNMEVIDGQ